MPITSSTDGEIISLPVTSVINQFILRTKLVGIKRDRGTNLATCKAMLESKFDNTGVFDLRKPMFVMECISQVLVNACKAGVMDVKSYYGQVDTEVTRKNMKRCITRKNKSQNVSKSLEVAQNYWALPLRRLIKHVKTRFSYIIQSFRSLLKNKSAINYLYGSMKNIFEKIREQNPYLTDWSFTSTVVTTMRRIVGIIIKNQVSGGK